MLSDINIFGHLQLYASEVSACALLFVAFGSENIPLMVNAMMQRWLIDPAGGLPKFNWADIPLAKLRILGGHKPLRYTKFTFA